MSAESKLRRKRAELADLRDERDRLQERRDGRPAGKRRRLNRALELIRRQIDRAKVRIRKLRKRSAAAKPSVVLTRISPNRSARSGPIQLIVLHSTESDNIEASDADLAGVAGWFANPASQVSAHVITDADGHSARCVADAEKAWHVAAYNSAALGIEQIGRASQSVWGSSELMETARWIALWSRRHEIPIQHGAVSGGTVTRPGVVTHADLGAAGGGHTDPGSAYPLHAVLEQAKHFRNHDR